MKEVLFLLLKIAVRFKILDKRFNVIEKKMPTLAKMLYTLEIIEEKEGTKVKRSLTIDEAIDILKEELNSIIDSNVSDSEFSAILKNGFLLDDNSLAFIILRVIAAQDIKHGLAFSNTKTLTLEHVLPEKHKKYWGDIDDVDALKYSIGNMLLIDLPENTRL